MAVGVAIGVLGGYAVWSGNVAGEQASAQILQRATQQLSETRSPTSAPAASSAPAATTGSAQGQSVQASPGQPSAEADSRYARGDLVGVVVVPSIDLELPVLEGIDADVLNQGVLGHYPGTGSPGSVGNFAVAGHRTTHGAPLYNLDEIEPGDAVVVQTPGGWDVYTMERRRIVDPEAVEVIAAVPDRPQATATQRWMVLTSCHPKLSAAQRMVVYARLDRQVPQDQGPPPELGPPIS